MQKLYEEKLTELSRLLEVEIQLTEDPETQKVTPVFDPSAMVSKLFAYMVYVGWNVQAIPPAYTGVHADIEFWKQHYAEIEKKRVESEAKPPEAVPAA